MGRWSIRPLCSFVVHTREHNPLGLRHICSMVASLPPSASLLPFSILVVLMQPFVHATEHSDLSRKGYDTHGARCQSLCNSLFLRQIATSSAHAPEDDDRRLIFGGCFGHLGLYRCDSHDSRPDHRFCYSFPPPSHFLSAIGNRDIVYANQ